MVTPLQTDKTIIDRVVYLASLVSDVRAVNPLLDRLRAITSQHQQGEVYVEQERLALGILQSELITYLTTKESVRVFTKESLSSRMELMEHSSTQQTPLARAKRTALWQTLTVIGLAFVAYFIATLVIPADNSVKYALAAPAFMIQMSLGLAWLFWSARHEWVPTVRRAFGFISLAVIVASLAAVQYPIFGAYPQLAELPVLRYVGLQLPFTVAYVLYYIGFYLYAKQIAAPGLAILKPSRVVLGAVLVAGAMAVLPHPAVPEEWAFDASAVCLGANIVFCTAAAWLGLVAARQITSRYSRAIRLFAVGLAIATTACVALLALLLTRGLVLPTSLEATMASLPFGIANILQLVTAYYFKRDIKA